MNTCYVCKGPIETAHVDHMVNRSGKFTLVKDLPVERCTQCGEIYLDDQASRKVDDALSKAALSHEHLDVPVVRCR